MDAFWLGLIDEVLGHRDLPLTRYFAEFQPDPPADAPLDPLAVEAQEAPPIAGV